MWEKNVELLATIIIEYILLMPSLLTTNKSRERFKRPTSRQVDLLTTEPDSNQQEDFK